MLVAHDAVQEAYHGFGFENYPDVVAGVDWARLHDAVPEE